MFSIAFGLQAPVVLNAYFKCFFSWSFSKLSQTLVFKNPNSFQLLSSLPYEKNQREKSQLLSKVTTSDCLYLFAGYL